MSKTLPGFQLTIEDNVAQVEATPALRDVFLIYAKLPETMKYEDEDGNIYDRFIEPNKPMLITSKESAMDTLDLSDVVLTREVKNIIKLLPNSATIALCRITTREGEQPNEESMTEMYEALDFAFEMTENYPIKQIIVAGMSLDKAVSLSGKRYEEVVLGNELLAEGTVLFEDVKNANGTAVTTDKAFKAELVAARTGESLNHAEGIYNRFEFKVNGETAMVQTENGTAAAIIEFEVDYTEPAQPVVGEVTAPQGVIPALTVVEGNIILTVAGGVKLVVDETTVAELTTAPIKFVKSGNAEVSDANEETFEVTARKLTSSADILTRILKHNLTITATQNNCMTFLSPEPPKNASANEIAKYVDRCVELYAKVRDRLVTVGDGKKRDLGMFLNVPVGVNMVDGVAGIKGFPQATVATVAGKKLITQKLTTAFEEGDVVEVYGHRKLDIVSHITRVKAVVVSDLGTTEIELEEAVPVEVMSITTPKYIMNVNNKDFNGTYLAMQYAAICEEVGVRRSPAGVVWPGECQVTFSQKQLDKLNNAKYAALTPRTGTTQGEVSKSQLMTDPAKSQFQDFENLKTIYTIVEGSKEIALKYKGERITEGTDVGMIKKEIEDTVFKTAVADKVITAGYELDLKLLMSTQPNGKKEKTMHIGFAVREVETLKLLTMSAKLF